MKRWRVLPVLFFLTLFHPLSAAGQSVHGRVAVSGDTVGVDGAELALVDSTGVIVHRTVSDTAGYFRLAAPAEGAFMIQARRLGFAPVSVDVVIGEREIVEVEVRMAEEAIPLEPLVVTARRRIRQGTLDEFYDRMDRNKERGVGWFFTRDEIEMREDLRLPILLNSVPGVFLSSRAESVQMRNRGEFCDPIVYVDGFQTSYRELQLMDMEGIEVYRGRWEIVDGYFPSDCGMIFLWRRPDWGNPFGWGRVFLAGGILALILALGSIL
jgi:hypothetical protein